MAKYMYLDSVRCFSTKE